VEFIKHEARFSSLRILRLFLKLNELFLFMNVIQHCFICRPADSTVSGGCWDRTQGCCDFGTESQTLL
jgi:hypothetical protein